MVLLLAEAVAFGLPTWPDLCWPWPLAPGLWLRRPNQGGGISLRLQLQAPFPASSRSSVTSRGVRSYRQAPVEGQDFLLLGDLRAGGEVMGQFGFIPSTKNDLFSNTPTLTQGASCGCCFPFFLLPPSPFFIFKENSRSAEGAQLRQVSGRPARSARRHRSSEPLPGEGVGRWAHSETTQTPARVLEQGLPMQ